MTRLLDAIRRHAEARPDDIAIDGDRPIDWAMLASILPILAADLNSRFDVSRPIAVRVDHGVAETLLDLALIEAGIPTIPLPPFFTPAQTDQVLAVAGPRRCSLVP